MIPRKHLLLTASVIFATSVLVGSQSFPPNQGLVSDMAQVLSPDEKNVLEAKLRTFEQNRSVEFAIVTVNSLQDMNVDEYAAKLFAAWGIGKKFTDNGVLLLIAPLEKKVRIEVGYGLEPVLTDGASGAIIRNVITPGWRSSHRADGILRGADAIIAALTAPVAEARAIPESIVPVETPRSSPTGLIFIVSICALFCCGALTVVFYRRRRAEDHRKAEARLNILRSSYAPSCPSTSAAPASGSTPLIPPRRVSAPAVAATTLNQEELRRRRHIQEEEDTDRRRRQDREDDERRRQTADSWGSSSSSGSDSSSSFGFGGGSSGGGGASGDL